MPEARGRIVFCWELGGGLGHLGPIHPVAQALQRRGFELAVISREVGPAESLFGDGFASVHQAPFASAKPDERLDAPSTYAHVLHNSGWSEEGRLASLVESWRDLFSRLKPSAIVCDHGPTALLAAHTLSIPAATFGTGFCCPPETSPLPAFRSADGEGGSGADSVETCLLMRMNRLLDRYQKEPFHSFTDLLYRDTEHFLTTFRELDHYPQRSLSRYHGAWSLAGGAPPRWPKAQGLTRAVAYLKPFAYLAELLSILVYQGVTLLVYCPGLDRGVRERLSLQGQIVFADRPVDLAMALSECDFGVFNAGHGSTVTALLAGKPLLQVPRNREQVMTAQRVLALGAGQIAEIRKPLGYAASVAKLLQLEPHQESAQAFANRYRGYDAEMEIESIADEIQSIAGASALPGACRPGGGESEVLLGLSPSRAMLQKVTEHFSQFPGVCLSGGSLPLLRWECEATTDEQIQSRITSLAVAYPGVSLVIDVGVAYLSYARRIASLVPSCSFLCVYLSEEELLAEYLNTNLTSETQQPYNHWSKDRTGIADHRLDACYPTYPTRDIATAITQFHRDYFLIAQELCNEYPDRFQIVDAELLPRIRHTAIGAANRQDAVDR